MGLSVGELIYYSIASRAQRLTLLINPTESESDFAKQRLFASITSHHDTYSHQKSWSVDLDFQWYLRLLNSYLRSLRARLEEQVEKGSDKDEFLIFKIDCFEALGALADILSSPGQLPSLDAIRLKMLPETRFTSAASGNNAYSLVFTMIGWLSMLYEPSFPSTGLQEPCLGIELVDFEGHLLPSDIYRMNSITLQEDKTAKLPLNHVFAQFGKFIPGMPHTVYPVSFATQPDVFRQQLVVSYLNFQTLYEVAEVRIRWVDCISLHLDFDEKTRCLKIFRFPSFCKLLCANRMEQTEDDNTNSPQYLST
jgi:hypothetical protein